MAFVTIDESKVAAFVGSKIGQVQQQLQDKVQQKIEETITTFVKANACPPQATLNRINKTKATLSDLTNRSRKVVDTYKALPAKLRPPINTLDKLVKVLLALPIPTAVPPGIGIPVSIPNKYSDLINKLRELIKQTKQTIEGIEALVDTTFFDNLIEQVNSKLTLLDGPIMFCTIENELKESLTDEELQDLGLLGEDGQFIISRLVPKLAEQELTDPVQYTGCIYEGGVNYGKNCYKGPYKPGTIYMHTDERRDIVDGSDGIKYITNNREKNGLDTWADPITGLDWEVYEDKVKTTLENLIRTLSNTSLIDPNLLNTLSGNLNFYKRINANDVTSEYYTARNGQRFLLEVSDDITAPAIAKKHFVTAKDKNNVIVMKGPSSFASDVTVLFQEIKFRLDQLQ